MIDFHNMLLVVFWYLAFGCICGTVVLLKFFRYINSENVKHGDISKIHVVLNSLERHTWIIPLLILTIAFKWPYFLYGLMRSKKPRE